MPAIKHHFKVKAEAHAVEMLLSDFGKVYYLFPGFASAEKADDGHRWFMKVPSELEAGTHFLTARILKREPERIEWEAVSPTVIWQGAFSWAPSGDHTEIILALEARDVGIAGNLHNILLSVELPDLARHFSTRTREILESKPWLNGLP